jgi:hypothetical protein
MLSTNLAGRAYELAEEVRRIRMDFNGDEPELKELQYELQRIPDALKLLEKFRLGEVQGESFVLKDIFQLPGQAWLTASGDSGTPQDLPMHLIEC